MPESPRSDEGFFKRIEEDRLCSTKFDVNLPMLFTSEKPMLFTSEKVKRSRLL
jgi:hypothetical protein